MLDWLDNNEKYFPGSGDRVTVNIGEIDYVRTHHVMFPRILNFRFFEEKNVILIKKTVILAFYNLV